MEICVNIQNCFSDQYKNHPLLNYRRQKEKQKEIQEIIKKQAINNRAKALKKKSSDMSEVGAMGDQDRAWNECYPKVCEG